MPSDRTPVHIAARAQARDARLQSLGFKDYSDYLTSSTWKAVKNRYRNAGMAIECLCGATDDIQFHHTSYDRVGGEERLEDLQPLCRTCHEHIHVLERQQLVSLNLDGFSYDPELAAKYAKERLYIPTAEELRREQVEEGRRLIEQGLELIASIESPDLYAPIQAVRRRLDKLDRTYPRAA